MFYCKFSIFPFLFLFLLANCSVMEPLDQAYRWRPHNIYKSNIALQVENKNDLIKGRTLPASDGHTATAAIQRWHDDNVKKLGNAGVAELSATGGGDQSSDGNSSAGSSSSMGGTQ